MNKTKTLLTAQGYEELKEELDDLINVKRPANIKAIQEARSLGDLSENAEYDAARNEQAEIEGRIKQLTKLLENVEIINENAKKDKVDVGCTVEITYPDDNEVEEYQIVGSQEADPFAFKISNESPLAQGILGHKIGEVVDIESPNGTYQVKITAIK